MAIGNPINLTSNVESKNISVIATAGQTQFTIVGGYRINQISVFRNGVRLVDGRDYTALDGSIVTLLSAATLGDALDFQIFDDFRVSDALNVNTGGNVNGNVTVTGILSTTNLSIGSSISLDSTSGIITATQFVGIFTGALTGTASTATNAEGLIGTPDITVNNIVAAAATFTGEVTYEDVTNIDSIGIITARDNIVIADKIIHLGDTNTSIRFPSADTFTVETAGTKRFEVNSTGDVGLVGIATATGLVVVAGSGDYAGHAGVVTAVTFDGNVTGNQSGGSISATTGAFSGVVTLQNNLDLQDDDKILLGTGDDLEIYHDGTNSWVKDVGTNALVLDTDGPRVTITKNGATETMANFNTDGSVDLYYDNSKKLETKTDGVDITGELQCDSLDVDGAGDITGVLTLHNNLDLQDDDKILLGTGDDLQIYHNGSNSFIDDTGTGDLYIRASTNLFLQKYTGETTAKFIADGAVELYHDNSKKLETKSDGVDITGELQCDSLDVDGNADISGTLQVHGETTFITHARWGDSDKALFGAGDDLQIYHDGTNSVIDDTGTGDLILRGAGDGIKLQKYTGETMAHFIADGKVSLYYDDSEKFQTTSTGAQVSGQLEFGDGNGGGGTNKLTFGASDDLNIYHNGTDSYISDTGTGSLILLGSRIIVKDAADSEKMFDATANGAVELYHDNSKKLETTSSGITVTGTVTDSLGVPLRRLGTTGMSGNYTLVASDAGKQVRADGAHVLTVPNNVFETGDMITVTAHSSSNVTIQGSGVTIYNAADGSTGNLTLAARTICTIFYGEGGSSGTNKVYIAGGGIS